MFDRLERRKVPFRKVCYLGRVTSLGKLEAAYFDLLVSNRGYLIENEWTYRLLWPDEDRLALREGKRLDMLVLTLKKKMPGIIGNVYGRGRYIPHDSGILIRRGGTAREVFLYVRPGLREQLFEPALQFEGKG